MFIVGMALVGACERSPPEALSSCAVRFAIAAPPGARFAPDQLPAVAPDGSAVAFTATTADGATRLWMYGMEDSVARPVPNTDEAAFPFWSPDGHDIGFFADGHVNRVDRSGRRLVLADAPDGRGGSWNANGAVIFSAGREHSIFTVSASGGASRQLTNVDEESRARHFWPVFMPDGTHFLYLSNDANGDYFIRLGSLRSVDGEALLGEESSIAYMEPGVLLAARRDALFSEPFDVRVFQGVPQRSLVAQPIARGSFGLASVGAALDGSVVVYAASPTPDRLLGLRGCDHDERPR